MADNVVLELVSDHKLKISSNDTTPNYLISKLVSGSNIILTEVGDGGNETLSVATSLEPVFDKVGIGTGADVLVDPLTVVTDAGGQAIRICENSGTEDWEFGVNADGDLLIQDDTVTKATFKDNTGDLIVIGDISGASFTLISGTITEFSADGGLSGNSDSALPTEKAVKTYVDAQVSAEDFWDRNNAIVSPNIPTDQISGANLNIDGFISGARLHLKPPSGTDPLIIQDYNDANFMTLTGSPTNTNPEFKVGDIDSVDTGIYLQVNPGTDQSGITGMWGVGNVAPTEALDVTGNILASGQTTTNANTTGTGFKVNSSADANILLDFNMDRAWRFMQSGTGSGTGLLLKSNTPSKPFTIKASDDSNVALFRAQSSGGSWVELASTTIGGTGLPPTKLEVIGDALITEDTTFGTGSVPTMFVDTVNNSVGINSLDTNLGFVLDMVGQSQRGRIFSNTPAVRYQNIMAKARGTLAVPLAVVNGDDVGAFSWQGYDGTNYQQGTMIQAFVDGAVSSGSVPTGVAIFTGSNSGDRTERLSVDSAGLVVIEENLLVDGGNIGISADPDLIQLTSGEVQINGRLGIGVNPIDPLDVVTNGGDQAIRIREASGTEDWEFGVNSDGDLLFQDDTVTKITFQDVTGNIIMSGSNPTTDLNLTVNNSGISGATGTSSIIFQGSGFNMGQIVATSELDYSTVANRDSRLSFWTARDGVNHLGVTIDSNQKTILAGQVEILTTTGALLVSRMTTAQKNALTPINGMVLYDSTLDGFQFYEKGIWVSGSGLA